MKNKCSLLILFMLSLFSISIASAQNMTVQGTIKDKAEEPIIGANVSVKGSSGLGTITDIDGAFSLSVPTGSTLVITYIGYKTVEVKSTRTMSITLEEDATQLDEVVVEVAYGQQTKASFTGSATTVTAKSLEKRPISTVAAAIEGNSPGVQVTSGLGQPGESASLRIRGFGSVNASNSPLYLLDGAIYNGELANINPADIETVTILKDAASTSLYGSSAGNGVVLITTKKGKGSDGVGVKLNITHGWSSQAYKDYDLIDVWDYYPMQWQMLKNGYITGDKLSPEAAAKKAAEGIFQKIKYNPFLGVEDAAIVGTDGKLSPSITGLKWGDDLDWTKAAFSTGQRQEYNLSFNTNTAKSSTYASVGYLNDNGYILRTGFERYSLRLNYSVDPTKWMSAGVRTALARTVTQYSTSDSDNNSGYSNMVRFVRSTAPVYPVHKHDQKTGAYLNALGKPTTNPAEYVYDYDGQRVSNTGRDAIAETLWNSRNISRLNSNGSGFITIKPIDGLSGTVNYSINVTDLRRKVYENPWVGDGTAGPGRLSIRSTRSVTQTANELLNYQKRFGDHNVDVMLGHENYAYKYEYFYSMKTREIVHGVEDFKNFTNTSSLDSYTDEYRKEGYFGRLNYDYVGKYYLSASYRYDGSSRFHPDNRWGSFGSVGLSWRISEEGFMKDIEWINNLKLRASYGSTGNDATLNTDAEQDYYPYQNLYDLGINNANEPGVYFFAGSNRHLRWESQISSDIAIDFTLFNRLTGTIEFFNKESSDLLYRVRTPLSVGLSSMMRNVGKARNYGVEVDLDYTFLRNKDWRVNARVNATYLKDKIVSLPAENRKDGIVSGSKILMEGHSQYTFYLYQWYGVDPKTGNGLYLLDEGEYLKSTSSSKDKNVVAGPNGERLTNLQTLAKKDFSGTSVPTVYGGFSFNVGYKQFDLSAMFSYSLGGKVLDLNYRTLMDTGTYAVGMSTDLKKAWQKEGDIAEVPRIDANSTHNTNINQQYSTRWLTSSNYLNLRTVTLTYTAPKKLIRPLNLTDLQLSLSAENCFMLKARQGLNPMGYFNGLTYNDYQPAKNFTLGVNVSF